MIAGGIGSVILDPLSADAAQDSFFQFVFSALRQLVDRIEAGRYNCDGARVHRFPHQLFGRFLPWGCGCVPCHRFSVYTLQRVKFYFLVTIEAPDAWHETAGLKGKDWCSAALLEQIVHTEFGPGGSVVNAEAIASNAFDPRPKSASGVLSRFRDFAERKPLYVVVLAFLAGYWGWSVARLLRS